MITDQIWVRPHHPGDETVSTRTVGQHFTHYNAVNFKERVEMTHRTIGNMYNWELDKWRNSRKIVDRGNKRRMFRNIVRFVKNPIGYTVWAALARQRPAKLFLTFISISYIASFFEVILEAKAQQDVYEWQARMGYEPLASRNAWVRYRENYKSIPKTTPMQLIYSHIKAENVVVNPQNVQNYRKYFDRLDFT